VAAQVWIQEAGDPGDPTAAHTKDVDPSEPVTVADVIALIPGET
jgi:hypothetical protein